jgi:hypothetical protein
MFQNVGSIFEWTAVQAHKRRVRMHGNKISRVPLLIDPDTQEASCPGNLAEGLDLVELVGDTCWTGEHSVDRAWINMIAIIYCEFNILFYSTALKVSLYISPCCRGTASVELEYLISMILE